jgi:hypothetical protein
MAGIIPLDPTVPISNPNARKIFSDEASLIPSDDPHELNCCLVTRDETLQFLSESPRKMFPQEAERIIDAKHQWTMLIVYPTTSGRFLSAPTAFLWSQRFPATSLDADEGPKVFAYQWGPATKQLPWEVIFRLAGQNSIMILNEGIKKCEQISGFLESNQVEHLMFHGRKEPTDRLRTWNEFMSGNCHVLVTTQVASRGFQLSHQFLSVFTYVPEWKEILHRTSGDSFILFVREEELDILRNRNIQPRLIAVETGDVVVPTT